MWAHPSPHNKKRKTTKSKQSNINLKSINQYMMYDFDDGMCMSNADDKNMHMYVSNRGDTTFLKNQHWENNEKWKF